MITLKTKIANALSAVGLFLSVGILAGLGFVALGVLALFAILALGAALIVAPFVPHQPRADSDDSSLKQAV